jgi:hypothetical protein
VQSFPGAQLDPDDVTFGPGCRFVPQSGISYGPAQRQPDFSITIAITGWFAGAGDCQLQLTVKPLTSAGAALPPLQLSTPFSIRAPVAYAITGTAVLRPRLQVALTQFGVGSFCDGKPPVGDPVGDLTLENDFTILTRGGPLDVSCTFRTKEWILPEGVRLKEIRWRENFQGQRCGPAGRFSGTFPALEFSLTRGAKVVRADLEEGPGAYTVFSDRELAKDGVIYASNLRGPREMVLPLVLATQCVSSATILQTVNGPLAPTLDPQAYRIILDSVTFEGPPGLNLL